MEKWDQAHRDSHAPWEQAHRHRRARPVTVVGVAGLMAIAGVALALGGQLGPDDPRGGGADDALTIETDVAPEAADPTGTADPRGDPRGTGPVPRRPRAPALGGHWIPMQEAPIAPRASAVAAWTGEHVLVWGGVASERWAERGDDGTHVSGIRAVPLLDGGLYDPVEDAWRAIAEAPLPTDGLTRHGGVWTGRELLALSDTGAAAYDPAADEWARLADPPDGTWLWETALWTDEMVVVLGMRQGSEAAVAYRPGSDVWRRLPDPPILDDRTAGLNGRAIVYGYWRGPDGSGYATSAYDPSTDRWSTPDPVPAMGGVAGALQAITADPIRDRVVLLGAAFEHIGAGGAGDAPGAGDGRWQPFLAAWRPPTGGGDAGDGGRDGGWRTHPRPEAAWNTARQLTALRAGTIAWVGDWADGLLFSFDGWRALPPTPFGPRAGSSVVWTGEELVVWGGRSPRGMLGDGARWHLRHARLADVTADPQPGPPRGEWPFGSTTD